MLSTGICLSQGKLEIAQSKKPAFQCDFFKPFDCKSNVFHL